MQSFTNISRQIETCTITLRNGFLGVYARWTDGDEPFVFRIIHSDVFNYMDIKSLESFKNAKVETGKNSAEEIVNRRDALLVYSSILEYKKQTGIMDVIKSPVHKLFWHPTTWREAIPANVVLVFYRSSTSDVFFPDGDPIITPVILTLDNDDYDVDEIRKFVNKSSDMTIHADTFESITVIISRSPEEVTTGVTSYCWNTVKKFNRFSR